MPPANDNFASATALGTAPGSVGGNTFDATQEGSEPSWFFDWAGQTMWYTFTPAATGLYRFTILVSSITYTGSGSGSHLMLAVSTDSSLDTLAEWTSSHGSIPADTYVAPGSGGFGGSDDLIVDATLTSGQTYYVRVSSNRNSGIHNRNVCSFTLGHEFIPAPANDDFADAEVIVGIFGSVATDASGATNEVDEPVPYYWFSSTPDETVWFSWTCPVTGYYKFRYIDDDFEDPALAVYTGASLGSLVPAARNDDSGPDRFEEVSVGFLATGGLTYKIQLYTDGTTGTLAWETLDPQGLSQEDAVVLQMTTDTTFDNYGAAGVTPVDADDRIDDKYPGLDVTTGRAKWFVIRTGDVAQELRISSVSTDAYSAILVYEDIDGVLTPIDDSLGDDAVFLDNADGGIGTPSVPMVVNLEPGSTYYIVFAGYTSAVYDGGTGDTSSADISQAEFDLVLSVLICYAAEDIINASSPSASVVSGRVREGYVEVIDVGYIPEIQPEAALEFTWTEDRGMYKMEATGRYASGFSSARLLVSINGRPIMPVGNSNAWASAGVDETWVQYAGLGDGVWDTTDLGDGTWLPLTRGDLVEVFIISDPAFDLETICFEVDPNAPTVTTYQTGLFAWPPEPLGDQWGSPNGWGGQKLVPDQIWTDIGVVPYDESDFPWGVDWADIDFVALPDGTVYAIVHDGYDVIEFPLEENHYVVIKKYDPGTGVWTQIEDQVNIHDPTDRYWAGAVSCAYDGQYVYFVWWENTSIAGSISTYDWHCKRLDPSDDSIVELGTGQHAVTPGADPSPPVNYVGNTIACGIACAGDGGDVYVSALENAQSSAPGNDDYRLFVWRWDGATWTDLALPDPSAVGTQWELWGDWGNWNFLSPIICARHGEGPVTDGFTLAYTYRHFDADFKFTLVTIPYTVGSGWGAEILSDAVSIENTIPNRVGPDDDWDFEWDSVNILWHPNLEKLVLVADLADGGVTPWDIFKMNDAGTDWEVMEEFAPAAIAADWRFPRGWADIGPDGNVYVTKFSASMADLTWEPKLFKHAPGLGTNYAVAGVPAIGEAATPYPWYAWMYSTTLFKIQIVGEVAYILAELSTENYDHVNEVWPGDYGEGHFVFALNYVEPPPLIGPISMRHL